MSVDEAFNVIQIGPEPPVPSCRSGLFRPAPLPLIALTLRLPSG